MVFSRISKHKGNQYVYIRILRHRKNVLCKGVKESSPRHRLYKIPGFFPWSSGEIYGYGCGFTKGEVAASAKVSILLTSWLSLTLGRGVIKQSTIFYTHARARAHTHTELTQRPRRGEQSQSSILIWLFTWSTNSIHIFRVEIMLQHGRNTRVGQPASQPFWEHTSAALFIALCTSSGQGQRKLGSQKKKKKTLNEWI